MEFNFEQRGSIEIFSFSGEMTSENESRLQIALMRATYSLGRAVLNFRNVTHIDGKCLQLLKQAYLTSIRLHNPLVITEIPPRYLTEISGKPEESIEMVSGNENEYTRTGKEPVFN